MTKETIEKMAQKLGWELEIKKHLQWDNVLHANGTALVFDCIQNNNQTIIHNPNDFPRFCTKDYLINAIEDQSSSLGYYLEDSKTKLGDRKWFHYDE